MPGTDKEHRNCVELIVELRQIMYMRLEPDVRPDIISL
jgi:hypothetical protein